MIRLLAGALFATSLASSAFADPEPAPLPSSMQEMLKKTHNEKYSSISVLNEQGQPMEPDAFMHEIKAGHMFDMKKQVVAGQDPQITMRLVSKEEVAKRPAPLPNLKPGDAFPAFQLDRLDGSPIDNAALAGRYTLVSFYFATCSPCVKEVPALNALAARRKDINMLAVTFDSQEEGKQFVEEHHLAWPIVPRARDLINAVGVRSFPTLALLDPQGKVVEFSIGGELVNTGAIDGWLDARIRKAAD
jgi:peroxiredoxin